MNLTIKNMNFRMLFFLLALFSLSACSRSQETIIIIETPMGKMKARLFDSTPKHKANMIKLVKEGYYDGTLFHRVIPNFMIQGGDPESKKAAAGMMLGNGGPGYTIPAEIGKFHFKGALAAARLGDAVNPKKESSGSQFYIVQGQPADANNISIMTAGKNILYSQADLEKYAKIGGTPFLDGGYTVFGEVFEGLEVIDKITAVECNAANRPMADIPMKISIQ